MHRAVVLTTLVVLLLAVVGVSAAQENGIFLGGPSSDTLPGSCAEALRALSDEDLDALEETLETALVRGEGSFEDFHAVVTE
jgi:hypothetical protein